MYLTKHKEPSAEIAVGSLSIVQDPRETLQGAQHLERSIKTAPRSGFVVWSVDFANE